ncbi:hypothetical protein [Kaarinaea lacus]
MKDYILTLAQNPLLQMLMMSVFSYTAFTAVIIAVMQTPPEAILNSGLQEILLVFEGFPDTPA